MKRTLPSTIIPAGIALAIVCSLPFDWMIVNAVITDARMERAFRAADARSARRAADRAAADAESSLLSLGKSSAKGGSTPPRLPSSGEKGARFNSADVFSGETKGTAGPAATVERNLDAGHIIFSVGTRPWKSQSPRSDAGSTPAASTIHGGAPASTGETRPMEAAEKHSRKSEQINNRQLPVAEGGLTASRGPRLSVSPKPGLLEGSR